MSRISNAHVMDAMYRVLAELECVKGSEKMNLQAIQRFNQRMRDLEEFVYREMRALRREIELGNRVTDTMLYIHSFSTREIDVEKRKVVAEQSATALMAEDIIREQSERNKPYRKSEE